MRNQIVNTNIKVETLRKALEFFYTVGDKVAIDEIKKILEEVDNSIKCIVEYNKYILIVIIRRF